MEHQGPHLTCDAQVPNTLFTYEPLQNPSEQIRLLRIQAQQPGTCLKMKLSVHNLADAHFYAMSYTWGVLEDLENVAVNGRLLSVTKNCHYALTQVRSYYSSNFGNSFFEDSPKSNYLWIDSICINQKDDTEKGHQVGMMGRIYGKASKVLACVGPHADNSERLGEVLNTEESASLRQSLARFAIDNPFMYENDEKIVGPIKTFVHSYTGRLGISEVLFETEFRKSFFAFASRSYWSRVWIIQEIAATGRSGCRLEVFCGLDRFSRSELSLLFYIFGYLHDIRGSTEKDKAYDLKSRLLRHCFKYVMNKAGGNSKIRAEDVLFEIDQSFKCRQPEDRVYGVLSLMTWSSENGPPIQPVYGASAAFDLAERIINMQRHLYLEKVQDIMVALEIHHDEPQLENLVRTRSSTSQEDNDSRHNLPYQRLEDNFHCAMLSKNNTGQLTAVLVPSNGADFGSSVLDEKVSNLLCLSDKSSKTQLMYLGSQAVGILCSRAQAGDLIVEIHVEGCLLVLRRVDEGPIYDIVGQGILSANYCFPYGLTCKVRKLESWLRTLQDISVLRRKLEGGKSLATEELEFYQAAEKPKVEAQLQEALQAAKANFFTQLTFNIAPVDLMILVGQDLEKDGSRNAEKSLQRLTTEICGTVEIDRIPDSW
ncbi:uncharacterized protein FRV6_15314 [Fusarium oxysporum]|uniref:Heterokaryon incompatibility domain-containing protein n=1 Tax=Fusarium oxysporum TaxID=5507 RepID=A0A2H3U724_FUSOX|nr:uncharacterized protein FRV6_15314 [Fusarium oxysporum]